MKNLTLEEAVSTAITFYIENNFKIPSSVVEYISCFPKGMSRQVIQARYGIKTSEFVKLLNPNYRKPLSAKERVLVECERLNYKLITDPESLSNNRDIVEVECIDCKYNHSTTITSLSGTILGCPKCKSGNLPWIKRQEELDSLILENYKCIRVSEVPTNEVGFLTLKHLVCGTEYTTQLVGLVHPNSKNRGTCPNCRSSDRRVTVNSITFGSQFEADCYTIIAHLNPELHVKYSDYFTTSKRWVCDFKIDNYWVEVSNFKTDYKNYFQNIKDKEQLVEANNNHFFFIRTLKEMEEFASLV